MKRLFNGPMAILLVVMLAMNFVNGRFSDPKTWILGILEMIPGIIIGLSVHEFAHAFCAYKLGDSTPKDQGRVTLNPVAHLDPIGLIALIFCGFGWGIPVVINPSNFKKPRRDEILVSLAGVFMNLVMAILFSFVLKLLMTTNLYNSVLGGIIINIVVEVIFINIVLMIFNLLPIPPLDGFSLISEIFNLKRTAFYYKVYDKGFLLLLLLIIFNILDKIMTPAITGVWHLLQTYIVF